MHWILQSNLFREEAYDRLVENLVRLNIPHSIHKVIPFVGELVPEANITTKNVMCMGAYSLRHTAKKNGWTPGVFDLEPFDFQIQMEHWPTDMLNADAIISRFEDAQFTEEVMFIRPIHDSKVFPGKIMDKAEFDDWQRKVCVLKLDYGHSLTNDTLVQVCKPKKIYSEHRFWIVKGSIITCSTYKIGDKVIYKPESEIDQRFKNYVYSMIDIWQPLEAFVIDVADTTDGLKIVEINSLNSCGFYAGDMQKLVIALETFSE